ncbi:hypothetical protein TeGR_g10209, partial [Tetraparma gracilis]
FVLYPVGRFMATAAYGLLSFVNEKTRSKFVLTDDLSVVCAELGLSEAEVADAGGVQAYVKKAGVWGDKEKVEKELDEEFGL